MAEAYTDNVLIRTYLDTVREWQEQHTRELSQPYSYPDTWDYATLQQKFAEGMRFPHISFSAWGEAASEHELNQAAVDLSSQTDPRKLEAYLSIFQKRVFPLDLELLIPFTAHDDDMVRTTAFDALALIAHPIVRSLALHLIQSETPVGDAVGLLNANFEREDWSLIQAITAQPLDNPMEHHILQVNVRHIAETHPDPASIDAVKNMCEFGPCTQCREWDLEMLWKQCALTDTMREECRYDANMRIRTLIRNNFQREETDEE